MGWMYNNTKHALNVPHKIKLMNGLVTTFDQVDEVRSQTEWVGIRVHVRSTHVCMYVFFFVLLNYRLRSMSMGMVHTVLIHVRTYLKWNEPSYGDEYGYWIGMIGRNNRPPSDKLGRSGNQNIQSFSSPIVLY